jgi:UDP-N-acetylglucosamine 2-epimerase (non-hydrolysing)
MSGDFFEILELPEPDVNLGVGSGSHAMQTARVMEGLDQIFDNTLPGAVMVYGDVNSTLAASLVASKRHILWLHVEAGLRSGDRTMPEELNRLVTDQLSDLLFTHSRSASKNLMNEGVPSERIKFVGNVMIDTLQKMLPRAEAESSLDVLGLPAHFALVTLHRPSNVDDPERLVWLMRYLSGLAERIPIVFPVHPRTRARLDNIAAPDLPPTLILLEPMDYLRFILLQKQAAFVITDSGGIQEETTALGTPCLTLRTTTERPVTVDVGTNSLVGEDPAKLDPFIDAILAGSYKTGDLPELWDGKAGERIADILAGPRDG